MVEYSKIGSPGAEGRGFSHNGKTLLSAVDPEGKADRAAAAVPLTDRTLYLCPSPLFGYGLEVLLNRLAEQAPRSALLCVEADSFLYALSREHLAPFLKKNAALRLAGDCTPETLCAFVRREWGQRSFRRVETLRLNGGWRLFPDLYEELIDSLRAEIALDWGNALTLTKLGRRYIRNAIRNLALVPCHSPLSALSFGTVPVLVLGAGPSMDKTLDFLAAYFAAALPLREKRPFRIICADTCLPALRERNISPDLVVILESQHWNLNDFTGLSNWNVRAAVDLSALPRSAAVLSGGVFLFCTPWTELNIFDRLEAAALLPPKIPPLGSVGLTAVSIARRLTRGAVLTSGLDFSFTLDAYHARSTPGHLAKLRRQSRFSGLLNTESAFADFTTAAVSKTGETVRTSPAMRNYRDLFQREFSAAPNLFDIENSGLPLGVTTVSPAAACEILARSGLPGGEQPARPYAAEQNTAEKLRAFINGETSRLIRLRNLLTGKTPADTAAVAALVDECDYLWAHFPDYAGGRRPVLAEPESGEAAAQSFLKRLRVEIEPFLELFSHHSLG